MQESDQLVPLIGVDANNDRRCSLPIKILPTADRSLHVRTTDFSLSRRPCVNIFFRTARIGDAMQGVQHQRYRQGHGEVYLRDLRTEIPRALSEATLGRGVWVQSVRTKGGRVTLWSRISDTHITVYVRVYIESCTSLWRCICRRPGAVERADVIFVRPLLIDYS